MKMVLRQEEYAFLTELLKVVDKHSFDPVYKNIVERMQLMGTDDGINKVIPIEETDLFNVYDAIGEYINQSESGNYTPQEKKNMADRAKNLLKVIEEETGTTY